MSTDSDIVAKALVLLAHGHNGNPAFDEIMWDPVRNVPSFRRSGIGDYINLWLNVDVDGDVRHRAERNGGPAADSQTLWEVRG
jgi:hypothetical protein